MGGKNHQPCRPHLLHSTKMSRSMSRAFIALEQANVSLEDVIIGELEEMSGRGTINPVTHSLEWSIEYLEQMEENIAMLRKSMDKIRFSDLPSLRTMDLGQRGHEFVREGIVQEQSWITIVHIMRADGFYGVLEFFELHIQELKKYTRILLAEVRELHDAAAKKEVNLILEFNKPGNIKVAFFRLYTRWTQFQMDFLASSVLSTELWYANAANDIGLLLRPAHRHDKIA